jgi:hypothetical protein
MLGTLGLTTILADDRQRARLVEEVQQFAPLTNDHVLEKHIEIVVQIAVDDPRHLPNLLNMISRGLPAFTFQAEAVAVETTEGRADIRFRESASPALELRRLNELLPPTRFNLLRRIVEDPRTATADNLCREVFSDETKANGSAKARLAKLVHDLNVDLIQKGLTGGQKTRCVRFDKKTQRYFIEGINIRREGA